jgi:hypothetical protein
VSPLKDTTDVNEEKYAEIKWESAVSGKNDPNNLDRF